MNDANTVLIKDPTGQYELIANLDNLTLTKEPNGFVDDDENKADIYRAGVGNRFIVISEKDYSSLAALKCCMTIEDLSTFHETKYEKYP